MRTRIAQVIVADSDDAKDRDSSTTEPDFQQAEVRSVALGGWRVTDRLVAPDSPAHLLGFVEHHGDEFEVMLIGGEFSWTVVESMEHAIRYLLTVGRESAKTRSAGDLAWLAEASDTSFDFI